MAFSTVSLRFPTFEVIERYSSFLSVYMGDAGSLKNGLVRLKQRKGVHHKHGRRQQALYIAQLPSGWYLQESVQ
jgi:hypothetical protein